jgi:hypothetical protein
MTYTFKLVVGSCGAGSARLTVTDISMSLVGVLGNLDDRQ